MALFFNFFASNFSDVLVLFEGVSTPARRHQADRCGRLSPVRDPGVRESAGPGVAADRSFGRSRRPDSFLRAGRSIAGPDPEGALAVAGDDLGLDGPHEAGKVALNVINVIKNYGGKF